MQYLTKTQKYEESVKGLVNDDTASKINEVINDIIDAIEDIENKIEEVSEKYNNLLKNEKINFPEVPDKTVPPQPETSTLQEMNASPLAEESSTNHLPDSSTPKIDINVINSELQTEQHSKKQKSNERTCGTIWSLARAALNCIKSGIELGTELLSFIASGIGKIISISEKESSSYNLRRNNVSQNPNQNSQWKTSPKNASQLSATTINLNNNNLDKPDNTRSINLKKFTE